MSFRKESKYPALISDDIEIEELKPQNPLSLSQEAKYPKSTSDNYIEFKEPKPNNQRSLQKKSETQTKLDTKSFLSQTSPTHLRLIMGFLPEDDLARGRRVSRSFNSLFKNLQDENIRKIFSIKENKPNYRKLVEMLRHVHEELNQAMQRAIFKFFQLPSDQKLSEKIRRLDILLRLFDQEISSIEKNTNSLEYSQPLMLQLDKLVREIKAILISDSFLFEISKEREERYTARAPRNAIIFGQSPACIYTGCGSQSTAFSATLLCYGGAIKLAPILVLGIFGGLVSFGLGKKAENYEQSNKIKEEILNDLRFFNTHMRHALEVFSQLQKAEVIFRNGINIEDKNQEKEERKASFTN